MPPTGFGHALGNDLCSTGGEEQGGTFTHDAAHSQNAAGHDAVDAAGQHDGADDVPLACTQTHGTLTVALRHRFQAFLRCTHDGRQVHDRKRQRTGKKRRAVFAEDQHTDQAVDDRGDTRKRFRRIFDGGDKLGCILSVGRILGESAALLFTAGSAHMLYGFWEGLHNAGATLTVALYFYAKESSDTGLVFAIAAILMLLTMLINLAAALVGSYFRRKQQ